MPAPTLTYAHTTWKATLGDGLRIASLAADLGWKPAGRGRQAGEIRLVIDGASLTVMWGPNGVLIRAEGAAAFALVESAADSAFYRAQEVQP
jgi:hypothetical protein